MPNLVVVPARSPARAILAAAIAERTRVAEVLGIHEQKLAAAYVSETVWERRDEIERTLARTSGATGTNADAFRRMERAAALVRGEDPIDPVDPAIALRAELKEIDEKIAESRATRNRIDGDVSALHEALGNADRAIRSAVADVMAAEGGRDALIAAHAELAARAAVLARAIDGAASPWIGGPKPHFSAADPVRAALSAPCPWEVARDRLVTDPDAPIPTVEAAFASVGGQSSARDAA